VLYTATLADEQQSALLAAIETLCDRVELPHPAAWNWTGVLARQAFGHKIGDANGTDPNSPPTAAGDPKPCVPNGEDWRALEGYQRAMRYGSSRFGDAAFKYNKDVILALHFMITEHNPSAEPGRLRVRNVQVQDVHGEVVYEPPEPIQVSALMDELLNSLNCTDDTPAVIRAAIVHLNIIRIHPFQDGNGRTARCLQALVLMRSGFIIPEIASLEEYIGQHIRSYNEALHSTGRRWQPQADTRLWINFCLKAHYVQAAALLRKLTELEDLRHELQTRLGGNRELSVGALECLGKIFGSSAAVIARWWRMRPDRVIDKLLTEQGAYRVRRNDGKEVSLPEIRSE
jgi:fido (protein-threonine AMPylation protein)